MKTSILFVGNFLSGAGGNRSVGEELAEQFNLAGYSVITTSKQPLRALRLLDMIFTAWTQANRYQAAYVEVYSGLAFIWSKIVCRILTRKHKPYVLALHGGNLPAFAEHRAERVQRLLMGAGMVTAPSHYLLETMSAYRSDICLLPNPIELQCYSFRSRSTPKPRLIWLRAFHSIYNPRLAPMVIAELKALFPEITLTMVGPDKGDGSLQATRTLIDELGLQGHIEIIPGVPKNKVPQVLAQGDIFINTTNVDNTPVSILEAMACGLCIVSTDVGGIPYLLEHEQDALLVPPNDPGAMSSAVKRILDEPELAERLSRNARRKAEQFDWSVVLPQWEKLFEGITTS